jgi:trehalose/maltose hydrolase-like predicted phosphorylase
MFACSTFITYFNFQKNLSLAGKTALIREDASVSYWHINEDSFTPVLKKVQSQETVFTIGNGYFCTRGTFEEGYPRANPATLLFGVFDEIPVAREELANAPDWTVIKLFLNNERFRLDRGTLLDYHRSLDMQHGILHRSLRWESPNGIRLSLSAQRFASLADEHVGAIRLTITLEASPENAPVDIAIRSSLDTSEGNYDVLHWETVDQGHKHDLSWLLSETKRTGVRLAQSMSFTTQQGLRKEFVDSDVSPSIRFYGSLTPGSSITTDKILVMYTSRDNEGDPVRAATEHHLDLLKQATQLQEPDLRSALLVSDPTSSLYTQLPAHTNLYDLLLQQHTQAWLAFWQTSDVVIEGDEQAQLGIRYNIYQLRINASLHDSRYSIAAKGLTGFGYRGHVFHDTEIFMLPFFTYVMPDVARNLLLYRYHLLPAARQKAASNGYEGAQYPWESTLSGEETTPGAIVHPETGEVIPVLNGEIEQHITSSIAHAVYEYWRITSDNAFLHDYGAELLLDTAKFWASRAEKHDHKPYYEITNVIGPDEWHEHVSNNVYTNYMARRNIRVAFEVLDWLKITSPAKSNELIKMLDLHEQRLEHWRDVERNLRVPQDPKTGVFEQFDGFFKLEPLDQELYKGRNDSYQGIMGLPATQKYRIIKQADVLMLLTILDQEFDLKTKQINWDYYYPITDHDYGSSLTPALHVILACELGEIDRAYQLFMKGALVDLENLRNNTPDGIHTACAGAVWQAAILGFAGLKFDEQGYTTDPRWPANWTRLAFTLNYKGETTHIDLHK